MAAESRAKNLPPCAYDIGEFMGGYKKRSAADYLADYKKENAVLHLAASTAKPLPSKISVMPRENLGGTTAIAETKTAARGETEPRLKRPAHRGVISGKRVKADNAALGNDVIDSKAPDYDEPPPYQRQDHVEAIHSDLTDPPAKKQKRVPFADPVAETASSHGIGSPPAQRARKTSALRKAGPQPQDDEYTSSAIFSTTIAIDAKHVPADAMYSSSSSPKQVAESAHRTMPPSRPANALQTSVFNAVASKLGLKTRKGVVKMYPKKPFRKRNFIPATDIAKPWPEGAQARITFDLTEGDFAADVQVPGMPRSRQHKIIEPSKRNPAPSHSTAAVDDVDSGTSIALLPEDTAQQPALHGELSYIAENAAAMADVLIDTQTIETAETGPVQDEGKEVEIDILELKELVGKLTEKNGKLTEKNGKLTEKYRALKKENRKLEISNADMLSAFAKAGTGSRVHAQGEAYKARAEKRQLQGEMTELFELQDRRKNEKMALITDRMAMEAAEPVEEVVFFGERLVARTDKVSALDDEVRKAKMRMAAAVGFVADDGWDELGGAGDV
ncbi:hypothetical protein LTS10_003339 [Elasticomyces elasticus]|nr:hypothetical protein LTS10_003339 [Elasticomyces elasticus]